MASLTPADHERIVELGERKWSAGRIAAAIGKPKSASAVMGAMYSLGLKCARPHATPKIWTRGGRVYRSFCDSEDAFIEALRVEGESVARIARLATEEFGHPRSPVTVRKRLIMLASRDDCAPLDQTIGKGPIAIQRWLAEAASGRLAGRPTRRFA